MKKIRMIVALGLMLTVSKTAASQDSDAIGKTPRTIVETPAGEVSDIGPALPLVRFTPRAATTRPGALPPLYITLAILQGVDGYSTNRGVARGAVEANGVMAPFVGNPARFWAVKVAITALPIIVAERMWKKNRAGAIMTLVATNTVSAIVAAHNARVLGQLGR